MLIRYKNTFCFVSLAILALVKPVDKGVVLVGGAQLSSIDFVPLHTKF